MNIFSFTGNLGKECRKNTTQGGVSVLGFTVAVKSGFGKHEQTLWIDCSLWGKKAEGNLQAFLTKGQQVAISGELGTREHDGKTYLTCKVAEIDLVGGKPSESAAQVAPAESAAQVAPAGDNFDDDIPF